MDRRVSNEIKTLLTKYPDISDINVCHTKDSQTVKFQNKTFILSKDYPFIAPKVLIDDKPYLSFLKTYSIRVLRLLYKNNRDCLCCSTILCNNWSPTHSIDTVLIEIGIINMLKRRIKYQIFLEEINCPEYISYNILSYL